MGTQPLNPKGIFTIKNAYKLASLTCKKGSGSSSYDNGEKALWKSIWNLVIPEKVKKFIWKACTASLPTRHDLYTRKVLEKGICTICFQTNKTIVHALWSYPTISDVFTCHSTLNKWPNNFSDFKFLWSSLVKNLDKFNLVGIAITLRNIWLHRNGFIFNEKFLNHNILLQRSLEELDCFHRTNKPTCKASPSLSRPNRWSPPPDSFFKPN